MNLLNQNAQYISNLSIANNTLYFLSNNTIWKYQDKFAVPCISEQGNIIGFATTGDNIVFTSDIEGNAEIFISRNHQPPKRLTYFGYERISIAGLNDQYVFVSSAHESKSPYVSELYRVELTTGQYEKLPFGENIIKIYTGEKTILQKLGREYGSWNNYQGGQAGTLWIKDQDTFSELLRLQHNAVNPSIHEDRVCFLSDYTGIGQIHSCDLSGQNLKQHSNATDYYILDFAVKENGDVFYLSGGKIYHNDQVIDMQFPIINHNQITLTADETHKYIQDTSVSSNHSLIATIRGNSYLLSESQSLFYDHGRSYFINNTDILTVKCKKETEVYLNKKLLKISNVGIVTYLAPNPSGNKVLATNTRNELMLWDLQEETSVVIDNSGIDLEFDWSHDGNWIVYNKSKSHCNAVILVKNLVTGSAHEISTDKELYYSPIFDQTGKYILFCSTKALIHSYPYNVENGSAIYVVNLNPENTLPVSKLGKITTPDPTKKPEIAIEDSTKKPEGTIEDSTKKPDIVIDFNDIQNRIETVKISDHDEHYTLLTCTEKGPIWCTHESEHASIDMYEWESMKTENLARDISSVLFCNHEWTACIHHQTIVTFKTGTKLEEEKKFATKQNGGLWLLPKVSIKLQTEWQEIFDKAWKLQKEHSNSGNTNATIDWDKLYDKFNALLPTARARNDVNKIIMQFHGAIGLSHNYITNRGDIYKPQRTNTVGTLSAQWKYQNNAWYIEKVLDNTSLARCGVQSNTLIKSIDGIQLDQHTSPNQALLGKAASKIHLETANDTFMVCTSKANGKPFYQDFVQQNAKLVGPDIGYIHIPDMMARGMKCFWNQYKLVYKKKALLLDVRNNGGGNASSTIFSYLLRKRLGLDLARYTHEYEYLSLSPTGPMVLITNEWTCSDGELFAVAFKDMKLGPVVGMRTWGGVIGIESSNTNRFNDHGVTTQAAFPLLLHSGAIIENKGVDPDIVIENKPGCLEDTQLLKAKEIALGLI